MSLSFPFYQRPLVDEHGGPYFADSIYGVDVSIGVPYASAGDHVADLAMQPGVQSMECLLTGINIPVRDTVLR